VLRNYQPILLVNINNLLKKVFMKRIVAATDFSAASLSAVNYAADLATALHAKLMLIHVSVIPVAVSEIAVPAYNLDQMEADARQELEKLREKLIVRTSSKIIIHAEISRGEVVSELKAYCDAVKPFAVVMGAEGISAVERFLFGGKTVAAIKELRWPLIIVPSGAAYKNIRKIGFACDFRDVVESVRVEEIKNLVEEFDAELHVLHVTNKSGNEYSNEMVEEAGALREMLGEIHPRYHFIKEPNIEKALTEFSETNKLDLLIIVPKRHNVISTMFRQRHSKKLVLETQVPIMSLHE